jgi:hypothetical protein
MAIKLNDYIASPIVEGISIVLSGTGGARLNVYDGVQPSTAGGTSGASNLLVQFSGLTWVATSYGSCALTNSITGTAGTGGTVSWARLSDVGETYIFDGNCGTAATCDFIINVGNLGKNQRVVLYSASIVLPLGWNGAG